MADLTVELFLRSDEKIVAGSNIKLYEFQDCNHSDLEKSYSPAPVIIAMGKTKKFDIGAASNEETFDAANAEFTATHIKSAADLGRPNEPSNVIASTRNISLICAATGKPCPGKNVGVEWQDNATNETGYEIRNTTTNQSFLFAPDTTHFTFTNLERITHCFQVRAVGAAGPSDWTPVGERKECV
ncbi:fibronectin type III domain-containing protein [Streptomyces sp. NPDC101151]|uniref:fibronectin type III domain-containing protein n=1 Tax=Streptomyces sp. NPDC101151 TaxID=3366115 RepID=UPI00381DE28B